MLFLLIFCFLDIITDLHGIHYAKDEYYKRIMFMINIKWLIFILYNLNTNKHKQQSILV